jgi:hypothetical protein
MKCIDPGHGYTVANYDGYPGNVQYITFMKRQGTGYPGNTSSYSGTNCQELVRVLIDRVIYLDNQIHCYHNTVILFLLRCTIWLLESRAARRHHRKISTSLLSIEKEVTCTTCGHIQCPIGTHS